MSGLLREMHGVVNPRLSHRLQVIYYGERISGAKLSQQLQALTAHFLEQHRAVEFG